MKNCSRRTKKLIMVAFASFLSLALAMPGVDSIQAAESKELAEGTLDLSDSGAVLNLPAPKFYAVFERKTTKAKTLYTAGQLVVGPEQPGHVLRIEKVEATGILLKDPRKGRELRVTIGHTLPRMPDLVLVQIVKLTQLLYRSKRVNAVVHADPVLVALEGTRAILEIETARGEAPSSPSVAREQPSPEERHAAVPPSPSAIPEGSPPRRKLDAKVFSEIDVQEVAPNAYVLGADSLKPVFDNVNQMFTDIAPIITPAFSAQAGLSLDITSNVVDGVMNTTGFTVTNPKIAERFGIQVGDTILQINDRPVNNPLNAWATYQELIIQNAQLSELQIRIQRGRNIMTKSYTIR
jgi:hypothetical protein